MTNKMLLLPILAIVFLFAFGLSAYFGLASQRHVIEQVYQELENNPLVVNELSSPDSTVNQLRARSDSGFTLTLLMMIPFFFLAAGLFLSHGRFTVKNLLPSIKIFGQVIEGMSSGNLTRRIEALKHDELGALASHLNISLDKLVLTLRRFSKGSMLISNTARGLEESTSQLRTGMDETVNQVAAVAGASEEMSATSSEVAKNCASASASSEQATSIARKGETIVKETASIMEHINSIVGESAQNIKSLVKRSDQVGGVVELINDIAAQTNLLALNAAIEAARAGEHGRGFAVVSDEVRKLAENTAQATNQIAETINSMQEEMKQAVISMEEGVEVVARGAQDARDSDAALRDIMEHIQRVSMEIHQIAAASEQQTMTATEIASNLQVISTTIADNAANVASNAQASTQLSDFSSDINKMIGGFRLYTPDDVKHMVEKAYAYIKKHGKERAFEEFNNLTGEFIDGELYIFAQDLYGLMIAHGRNSGFVGMNVYDGEDANGKKIGIEMIELVKTKGCGWYEYDILNPQTERVQPKIVYYQSCGDYYIACGLYK